MIGLTGGIGAGKTHVLLLFDKYPDVVTVNTDNLARQIMNGDLVQEALWERYGEKVFQLFGDWRKRLAQIIFSDQVEKAWIENLVHPLVLTEVNKTVEENPGKLVIVESAIIFESGLESHFEKIVLVWCRDRMLQRERAIRRGTEEGEVINRMDLQLWPSQVAEKADYVVYTDLERCCVAKQVEVIYQMLKSLDEARNEEEK